MWKEKLHFLGNYIIKHSKVVLPAVVVVAVAVTVSVSLSLSNRHKEAQQEAENRFLHGPFRPFAVFASSLSLYPIRPQLQVNVL